MKRSALLLLALLSVGCAGEPKAANGWEFDVVETTTVSSARVTRDVSNDLSFAVGSAVAQESQGNMVVSGVTTRRALAMLTLAATGKEREALVTGLHLPRENNAIVAEMIQEHRSLTKDSVVLADRLFVRQDVHPSESFAAALKQGFGAGIGTYEDAESGLSAVNRWTGEQTGGRVPEILPPGAMDSDTRFVLVDALAFRGTWKTPFEPRSTSSASFALAGLGARTPQTATVEVQMMHNMGYFGFARSDEASFLALEYEGSDALLLLAVPTRGTLSSLEHDMQGGLFERALRGLRREKGMVSLPKFHVSSRKRFEPKDLPSALRPALAGGNYGELGNDRKLDVFHGADIEVDERGTQAAAASAVIGGAFARPDEARPKYRVFRADQPFLFFLVSSSRRVILQGRITDPR